MEAPTDAIFQKNYQRHLQHLKLKGLQPKTVEAYSRAIRRIGERFGGRIDDLSEQQLTDHFTELVGSRSWSTVKLDLHGLKFYYAHVLHKAWVAPGLIKAPKAQRLPDIVTVAEVQRVIATTRVLSYPVLVLRGHDENRADVRTAGADTDCGAGELARHVGTATISEVAGFSSRKLRDSFA